MSRPPGDERTLRVLEFPKILAALAAGTATPMGRALALDLVPSGDLEAVRAALAETAEAVAIAAESEIQVRGARDVRPAAARAASGGMLEPADLLDVAQTLEVTRRVQAQLRAHRDQAPRLAALAERLSALPELASEITRALDDQGRVLDAASSELRRIRDEGRATERRLRESLERLIHDPAVARHLQESLVTVRGDRFVVPVRAEHRAQFAGIVHDASASGATLFMEPMALVPLGNRRRELEAAERTEVLRILRRLSGLVGEEAEALIANGEILGHLDVAAAKAALAARLRATLPEVRQDGVVRLRAARHPLLVLGRGDAGVVPVDVALGGEFTTLVVTGPNTGGKTVALKTVGLLSLMAQAGLFIPAADGSAVAWFEQVHADVGDEQSIEQNLSTFSSHMSAIVQILRSAAPPGLVLLDEVGAGTDPTEGVALARAIIQELHRRGLHTVVTTHYNELKMLASVEPGIENASVEFDVETLQPTFRLLIGLPGRSNALVIAERLGLAREVVAEARSHLAPEHVAIEQVLDDLTRDRQAAERDRADAAIARAAAREAEQRIAQEAEHVRRERQRLLAEARRGGEAIIVETRRRLDAVMAEVRAARTQEAVRRARTRLREALEALPAPEPVAPPGPPVERVQAGQTVFVAPLGRTATVVAGPDAQGNVEVEAGALRARVALGALREAPASDDPPASRARSSEGAAIPGQPAVRPSISVRGQTVDEALPVIDRYLDDAVRARLGRVTVIHGKGTGALRRAVRDFLRTHPHVRQFRPGERGEGGDGATVVEVVL